MAAQSPINLVTALVLLWLAGCALRLTILAVPPVIPLIHLDLHLSKTEIGILSGIPMVLFAGAAIAGSLLVARFGARRPSSTAAARREAHRTAPPDATAWPMTTACV